jgi:hypothetical protein
MLVELMIAVIIFMMVMSTLVLIWANSHRMLAATVRSVIHRNEISMAIKQISNDIAGAGTIDLPVDDSSQFYALAGASNVDQSGCFPQDPNSGINWFYYCFTTAKTNPGNNLPEQNLYYYSGAHQGGAAPGCPPSTAAMWTGVVSEEGAAVPSKPEDCGKNTFSKGILMISGIKAGSGYFYRNSAQPERIQFHVEVSKPVTTGGGNAYNTDKPFDTVSAVEFKFAAPFHSK